MIRVAETDADLARFAEIRTEASPREPVVPPRRLPGRLVLLWKDAAGALVGPSDLADSVGVSVFVRPEARRQGIGSALWELLVPHARTLADERAPETPAGLELVSVEEQPELLEAAYAAVAVDGYADMPTPGRRRPATARPSPGRRAATRRCSR